MMNATYSPEDNKLRLYSVERLDAETYARVRAAGFIWAPKQGLFVAPMWTPEREDLLMELCGEIGDEDTSLVDRAEERAERFEDYSDKRADDAERAKNAVAAIADNIPFGQPILVGHHSEKRARKDAERIENGMRKAVKMWETSKYWEQRAAGAIHHAKYKERPDVRARRIKGIEADIRRCKAAYTPDPRTRPIMQQKWNAERDSEPVPHVWCGQSRGGHWVAVESLPALEKHYSRWISHYENRLIYEKAMLNEQGASDLLKPKAKPKQLPICNYRAPEGITIPRMYHRGEFETLQQYDMTKDQYSDIPNDYRGCKVVGNSHRVRICLGSYIPGITDGLTGLDRDNKRHHYYAVFLTDSKTHEKPAPVEVQDNRSMIKALERTYTPMPEPSPQELEMQAMKDQLKTGIQIAVAPQLFPTPHEIAEKMVELADIRPGQSVLEPSAGTGNLLKALPCIRPNGSITAIEINQGLCKLLEPWADNIICNDFLGCNGGIGTFDRVIMNPPFINGADIKHINHALDHLRESGKLVALCANGPRQREAFMDKADYWEDLPAGSFKDQGTGVNVALMVITKEAH